MKKQLLKTYVPPRVDCVTLCTEQCMTGASQSQQTLPNMGVITGTGIDEGGF